MALNQQLAPSQSVGRPLDEARRAFDEVRQAIGPVRHFLEQAISDHPVKAVGLSLAMGVLLGWLIKR
jgi:ElaB/YqjD/DUF883 family membrane-anchored ribosome-binding protein